MDQNGGAQRQLLVRVFPSPAPKIIRNSVGVPRHTKGETAEGIYYPPLGANRRLLGQICAREIANVRVGAPSP